MSLLKYSRVATAGDVQFTECDKNDIMFFGTDALVYSTVHDALLGRYHLSGEVLPHEFYIRFDKLSYSPIFIGVVLNEFK